jgi:hypothetical protein
MTEPEPADDPDEPVEPRHERQRAQHRVVERGLPDPGSSTAAVPTAWLYDQNPAGGRDGGRRGRRRVAHYALVPQTYRKQARRRSVLAHAVMTECQRKVLVELGCGLRRGHRGRQLVIELPKGKSTPEAVRYRATASSGPCREGGRATGSGAAGTTTWSTSRSWPLDVTALAADLDQHTPFTGPTATPRIGWRGAWPFSRELRRARR